ncbi:hypothetical protein [Paenibacillus sp.]|uniref:RCC1 domain-containing protein n=1 Tax=Paenibacillus sp. TaxID=58172 RepID=UPI002D531B34|nr:hypothetical protein [Paenibacillus sp.]HZG56738.1 hypothetical protein [Paenibacillus sp.]
MRRMEFRRWVTVALSWCLMISVIVPPGTAFAVDEEVGAASVVKVEGGASFTTALLEDGTVWAWGNNSSYQLGTGDTTSSKYFRQVTIGAETPLPEAEDIEVGEAFALARTVTGSVYAWGTIDSYPLLSFSTPSEVELPTGVTVKSISAGKNFALALDTEGFVWAWGNDSYGQLGQAAWTTQAATPLKVKTGAGESDYLSDVVEIAAGFSHAMALKEDGTVWTWGQNISGQLGHSTGVSDVNVATQVPGLTGVTHIYSGPNAQASFATTATDVYAWGRNATEGELGFEDGNHVNQPTPKIVPKFQNNLPVSIHPVNYVTLALQQDGRVIGVGYDPWEDLLGLDESNYEINYSNTFVEINNLEEVQVLYTGFSNAFAMNADGSVWGWGKNNTGNAEYLLGAFQEAWSPVPTPVKQSEIKAYDLSPKPVENVQVTVERDTIEVSFDEPLFSEHQSIEMEVFYNGNTESPEFIQTRDAGDNQFDLAELEPGDYIIRLYTKREDTVSAFVDTVATVAEPGATLTVTAEYPDGEEVNYGYLTLYQGESIVDTAEFGEGGQATFTTYPGMVELQLSMGEGSMWYHDVEKLVYLLRGRERRTSLPS